MPRSLYASGKKRLEFATRVKSGFDPEHLKAYLLCFDCEQRLNQNGESEVLRHLAPKYSRGHPLHEKMRVAYARDSDPSVSRFAACDFDIDAKKFAYFAMSVVWRRTIHNWSLPDGTTLPRWELGDFAEDIRRYLLGESEFPPDSAVIVVVCSDTVSRRTWNVPEAFDEAGCLNFRFLARGIFFRVMMGRHLPQYFRDYSCLSPRECIFYGDCQKRASELSKMFSPTQDAQNHLPE